MRGTHIWSRFSQSPLTRTAFPHPSRHFVFTSSYKQGGKQHGAPTSHVARLPSDKPKTEPGAMSRRLAELREDSLVSNTRHINGIAGEADGCRDSHDSPLKASTPRLPTMADAYPTESTGRRLAYALDQTLAYVMAKDPHATEKERSEYRCQLKERFHPTSRSIPSTLQGLASLANQRIDDAISRGQFKNLPSRGKTLQRDYTADSPFLDTTEYFMNKIIKKQDIVPPWIEKQQEVISTATKFKSRLRADWRRHVARVIASRGGDLAHQIRTAEAYATAELGSQSSPAAKPFRDTSWENMERAYHTLAIESLNSLTRSYNLMAPKLAQRPYYSLDRELRACFLDVAPTVAQTIKDRSWLPAIEIETRGPEQAGIMAHFGGRAAKVHDEQRAKRYGFREFWRDIWSKET